MYVCVYICICFHPSLIPLSHNIIIYFISQCLMLTYIIVIKLQHIKEKSDHHLMTLNPLLGKELIFFFVYRIIVSF